MNPTYVQNPTASALDDAETERLINQLSDDDMFGLAAYAAAWDTENAEGQEEEQSRLALVRPPLPWYLLPIAVISIAVILVVVL